jgi:hypothetical protein
MQDLRNGGMKNDRTVGFDDLVDKLVEQAVRQAREIVEPHTVPGRSKDPKAGKSVEGDLLGPERLG